MELNLYQITTLQISFKFGVFIDLTWTKPAHNPNPEPHLRSDTDRLMDDQLPVQQLLFWYNNIKNEQSKINEIIIEAI